MVVHRILFFGGVMLLGTSLGCAVPSPEPAAPPGPESVYLDVSAVPLNPEDTSNELIGGFRYAGGIHITSRESGDVHGLSGLVVSAEGDVISVSDVGVQLTARLVLDEAGRLVGVTGARLARLVGEDGQPLVDKMVADAEGLAVMPGGDLLVSFERHARVLRYPADGSAPVAVSSPAVAFEANSGMEAIAADPETGADAYVVGEESTGRIWACRVATACETRGQVPMADGFGLTAMARLSGDRTAYLLRAYDPAIGTRIVLTVHGPDGEIARLEMAPPLTIDNFEGLAVVQGAGGVARFYLLSDDNVSANQRTLLLAFDWQSE